MAMVVSKVWPATAVVEIDLNEMNLYKRLDSSKVAHQLWKIVQKAAVIVKTSSPTVTVAVPMLVPKLGLD